MDLPSRIYEYFSITLFTSAFYVTDYLSNNFKTKKIIQNKTLFELYINQITAQNASCWLICAS
jgi:hypothetical protein